MIKCAVANLFHVVLVTDSLSLPRPWRASQPILPDDGSVRYVQTYPYLLRHRLQRRLPDKEVEVSNFAARASTLVGAWSHRLELFSWMEADVAVLHRGVVDCWPRADGASKPRVSLEEFEAGYVRLLLERDKLGDVRKLIVVGIAPTNEHAMAKNPSINEIIRSYNMVLKQHMRADMHFVDMEELIARHGEGLLHPDGHHMSVQGHAALAEELERAI